MSTKKEIVGADEKTTRIFKIYCEDTHLSDDTPAFALYLAGYKAATSHQDAKVKALVEALTEITELDASDTEEGFNEWGEAFCFGEAKRIAGEALSEKETP